ncbi:MAG: hypothetical protein QXK88_06880 [Desulfurococcaceae archaeon]
MEFTNTMNLDVTITYCGYPEVVQGGYNEKSPLRPLIEPSKDATTPVAKYNASS